MGIRILTFIKVVPNPSYKFNLDYLRRGLEEGRIKFQGDVNTYAPEAFVFKNSSTFYFTLSANPKIREDMTTHISRVLPGLEVKDLEMILDQFRSLSSLAYEGKLDQVGKQDTVLMKMLIFDEAEDAERVGRYVAHVDFKSISRRTEPQQFTVNVVLTCQRFTYFPLQGVVLATVQQNPLMQMSSNEFPAAYKQL